MRLEESLLSSPPPSFPPSSSAIEEKFLFRVDAVAGALLGASIAKDVNRKRHEGQYEGTEREVCRTVYRTERAQEIIGYDVSYSYNGSVYTSRMDYDPGNTIRLRVNVTPAQ